MGLMEFIKDGLAWVGLATLLVVAWAWWSGGPPGPASRPAGPPGPPAPPGGGPGAEALERALAARWQQDLGLLMAQRQMLDVAREYQAGPAAPPGAPTLPHLKR